MIEDLSRHHRAVGDLLRMPETRQHSRTSYHDLREAAVAQDADAAEAITRAVMRKSLDLWKQAAVQP